MTLNFYAALLVLTAIICSDCCNGQFTGSSDRTQQELNLLDWTAGIRVAHCQSTPIADLISPFREAVARMVNRFCRNATACRLKKSFTKHQVVILDGFPRRENRALNFRFFVVYPHEAIPLDRKADKPLIPQASLSELLRTQLSELTHGLGWQVLSHEKYPRFDKMTAFMNRALIPILLISVVCMFFLAYWSSSITSGSSLYSGGGWMVSGSTGGKNAALRRTLEIIAEQKLRFDARRQSMHSTVSSFGATQKQAFIVYKSNSRLQASTAPPRSLATSSAVEHYSTAHRAVPLHNQPKVSRVNISKKSPPANSLTSADHNQGRNSSSTGNSTETTSPSNSGGKASAATVSLCSVTTAGHRNAANAFPTNGQKQQGTSASQVPSEEMSSFRERLESMDIVPELIVMRTHNESIDNDVYGRKVSVQSHRRHSRRFSVSDEFKRKKSTFGGGASSRPKRWKAGSLMFSRFSFRRPRL